VRQAVTHTIQKTGTIFTSDGWKERPDQQSADFDILYKARPALDLMDKFTQAYTHWNSIYLEGQLNGWSRLGV
jgi:hypothetical protein